MANLKVSVTAQTEISDSAPYLSLHLTNGDRYARLLRFSLDWDSAMPVTPYLVLYDDNYFDLLPGESRTVNAKLLLPQNRTGPISGKLVVKGTNVVPTVITIRLPDATR